MNEIQKDSLKRKIIKGNELYSLQRSRIRRIFKNPLRTLPYYVVNIISKIKPFKIMYRTLWGDRMSFYLPESGAILYYGFFEPNLTNFFINFLQKGDIFFDVGAHVGYYSLLGSTLVEASGQIHSFEPTPRTFDTLKANATIKNNIFVNNVAVLDKESEIEFIDYGPKYSAFNSYKKRVGEKMGFLTTLNKIRVKTISLDSYCQTNKIVPSIIKIDAEGAEHLILSAMEKIIETDRPIITVEVAGDEEWRLNCLDSIMFLNKRGYIAYEISLEGNLRPHVAQKTYTYDNLVFAHPNNMDRIQKFIKL